jgi:hypothetical protein
MIDFQAFTAAVLLVVHLVGYSNQSPGCEGQDEDDWQLVSEVTDILRGVANDPDGSVAAQSANVLETISKCRNLAFDPMALEHCRSCKITVPYFGTINVVPGKKLKEYIGRNQTNPDRLSKSQQWTPPDSNRGDPYTGSDPSSCSASMVGPSPLLPQAPLPDDPWISLENVLALPNAELDLNGIPSYVEDPSLGSWANVNYNSELGLDQGWDVNWIGPVNNPSMR